METKIFETNKTIKDILVEKNVYKGYGLAHWNNFTIFIENAVAGDVLDIKINYEKSNSLFASIDKINNASPFRKKQVECEVFGECGGCDWLNIKYDAQLKIKKNIISELYPKQLAEIQESSKINHYRNKSFFPISLENGKPIIGMFKKKSHTVIEHNKCKLIPPIFDKILQYFKEYLIKSKAKIYDEKSHKGNIKHIGLRINNKEEILLIVVTKTAKLPFTKLLVKTFTAKFPAIVGIIQNINRTNTNRILGNEEKVLFGQPFFEEMLFENRLKINYFSFFQTNFNVMEKMYSFILEHLTKDDMVIDAYSGTGSIGISIAKEVNKVFCIENNKVAYNDSLINIKNNAITNCISYYGDVDKKIAGLFEKNNISAIIFDPPRKGIAQETLDIISDKNIRIIYVSCDPTTQKRDITKLLEKGFSIKNMKIFDMFPNTYHIENVIFLEKQ